MKSFGEMCFLYSCYVTITLVVFVFVFVLTWLGIKFWMFLLENFSIFWISIVISGYLLFRFFVKDILPKIK
jgi:hypothetical protein